MGTPPPSAVGCGSPSLSGSEKPGCDTEEDTGMTTSQETPAGTPALGRAGEWDEQGSPTARWSLRGLAALSSLSPSPTRKVSGLGPGQLSCLSDILTDRRVGPVELSRQQDILSCSWNP